VDGDDIKLDIGGQDSNR
jgi:hypothetical protein